MYIEIAFGFITTLKIIISIKPISCLYTQTFDYYTTSFAHIKKVIFSLFSNMTQSQMQPAVCGENMLTKSDKRKFFEKTEKKTITLYLAVYSVAPEK